MTVADAAHSLTAEATLKHLRQFGGALFLLNPCVKRRSRCVYFAPAASALLGVETEDEAVALLESQYALEVESLPSFVAPGVYGALQRRAEWLPSDSYICHGSTSQGSGRAVFKEKHQLKGVGRTRHVGHHEFFHDINGALSLREGVTEAAVATKLARVLDTPPIPIDFILVPEQGPHALILHPDADETKDIRCIMGRRGSPLRAGHLDYLTAALRTRNENKTGSYLVHLLLSHTSGVPETGIGEALLATFDIMMQRAIRLSAESLVYSLHVSYWPDNFDLFSRVFDVGETQFNFPALLADEEPVERPADGETPTRYFARLKPTSTHDYSHTLYPIRNVLSAMRLIAREVSVAPRALDERFTWEWLHATHRREVMCAIAKVLGLPEADVRDRQELRDILTPIADEFPLFPQESSDRKARFSWDAWIAAFERARPAEWRDSQSSILERGAAFRQLISADAHRAMLTELHAQLAKHVIDPYLRHGLDGIAPHKGARLAQPPSPSNAGPKLRSRAPEAAAKRAHRNDRHVDDGPYVGAFHAHYSPATTDALLLAKGFAPPRTKGVRTGFTYVDLGCSDGVGLLMLAAAHPEGHFIGIDASKMRVRRARALAYDWGITNVELRSETFAESTLAIAADYVIVHGVLAWISPESQTALLDLAHRSLRSGGVFSVGYNCVPRGLDRVRLQRFLRIMADTVPGRPTARFREALGMARSTAALDFAAVSALDAEHSETNRSYFAQEYVSAYWQPLWPSSVLAELSSREMTFIAEAQSRAMPDAYQFTAAQVRKLDRIKRVGDREDAVAIFLNSGFRVDTFVKGSARQLSRARLREVALDSFWMAQHATHFPHLRFDADGGEFPVNKHAARAIMDALEHRPAQLRSVNGFAPEALATAVNALFAQHYVAPAEPHSAVPAARRVNARLAAELSNSPKAISARVGAHGVLSPEGEPGAKREAWFARNGAPG